MTKLPETETDENTDLPEPKFQVGDLVRRNWRNKPHQVIDMYFLAGHWRYVLFHEPADPHKTAEIIELEERQLVEYSTESFGTESRALSKLAILFACLSMLLNTLSVISRANGW